MPKIGKRNFRHGDHNFEFLVHYNGKQGFYCTGIDSEIFNVVESDSRTNEPNAVKFRGHYSTEGDLLADIANVIRRYFVLKKTEKKIILMKIVFGSGIMMNRTGNGSFSGTNARVGEVPRDWHEFHSGPAYSIGFNYEIGYVVEDKQRTFFTEWEGKRSPHGTTLYKNREHIELEWTPEREQFFKDMVAGMENMAKAFLKFFGNKEQMVKLIDSRQSLLLGPTASDQQKTVSRDTKSKK